MELILQKQFPILELSYETDAHKKVITDAYDICISIPLGKKSYLWLSDDNSYFVDKTASRFTPVDINYNIKTDSGIGAILYGSICNESDDELSSVIFVIEDIMVYHGILVRHMCFGEKLSYIAELLSTRLNPSSKDSCKIMLPYMQIIAPHQISTVLTDPLFYDAMALKTAYATHHIQFRSSNTIVPYLNHNYKKAMLLRHSDEVKQIAKPQLIPLAGMLYGPPASRLGDAVFMAKADIQDDIYHLFCYDNAAENKQTYVDIAFIASRSDSVFMNSLFRNIRENKNLDLGEESEDEDIFQNISPDKYVDLEKMIKIKCRYLPKWRKWTPIDVAKPNAKCITRQELCGNNGNKGNESRPYKHKYK